MADINKTPNCDMHEALVSHLYNEASPEESRIVEAHLKHCAKCADELSAFERVRGMLQRWQVRDLPEVYITTKEPARKGSMLSLVRELLAITPLWAKGLGVAAGAMLVFAILGTSVSVSSNGFSMTCGLFQKGRNPGPAGTETIEQLRAELKTAVNSMIADSERQQREALKLQLASLESDLQNTHAADLAKVTARIQQQRDLIKTLERDIDRREGLALSDILFSEVPARSGAGQGAGD